MEPYVIRAGDHLPQLAHRHGFDADAIWNDPKNASLKALRGDGSILAPCDILYIPARPKPKWFRLKTGAVNTFVATIPTIDVTLRVAVRGKAHSNAAYTVQCEGASTAGQTDADGTVTFKAPVHAKQATITFDPPGPTLVARIGHLDPIATNSGVLQRLRHLGHLPHGAFGSDLASGLARLQRAANLPVTGELDDVTRAALSDAHGC